MENLVGRRLGPYEIQEFIAAGGMAEVYKGYHPELDRYVAIKIVGRHLEPDPVFNTRFRREAKAIAKLRHPNIVQVYDFGAAEGGHYMVMEYVDGSDLATVLGNLQTQNRLLDSDDITFLVRQMGLALDHAHSHGVVHRDVKPGNVMLTRAGQAILTDFGLALLNSRAQEDISHGTAFGTPEYMAPEQVSDSRAANPLSDLYSLGVVIFQMVTGELPFMADNAVDVALMHLHEAAPDPRIFDASVPPAVAAVINKSLEKNPRDRFRTGYALATALERAYADPDNVNLLDPPTKPRRNAQQDEDPAPPAEPVVNRGLTGREARQEKAKMRAEMKAIKREERRAERERTREERKKKRQRFLAVWGRTLVVVVLLLLFLLAGAYVLNTLGVISVAVPTADPEIIVAEADETPTATVAPTATATPTEMPTSTPQPTATPLQPAEASAVPPVVLAPPEAGEDALRLLDGQVIHFIPAGVFQMGTDDLFRNPSDRPAHPVRLSDYWLDRTEITNRQYRICVENGPCVEPEDTLYYADPEFTDFPVTFVGYDDAVAYCLWVANQTGQVVGLPTEAQWEKAARWDPTTEVAFDYPWGDERPNPDLMRFNESNLPFPAAPVASYPGGASPYGVLDMAGNVWEWTADWFDADFYNVSGVMVDPTGPLSGTFRVTRGGSWTRGVNVALSSFRNPVLPDSASNEIGFRCATNGGRLPTEAGIYAAPLDAVDGLITLIDEARATGNSDGATLDEWAATLAEIRTGLQGAANAEVQGIIAERVDRIAVQQAEGLLDPALALRLRNTLQWVESRVR